MKQEFFNYSVALKQKLKIVNKLAIKIFTEIAPHLVEHVNFHCVQ